MFYLAFANLIALLEIYSSEKKNDTECCDYIHYLSKVSIYWQNVWDVFLYQTSQLNHKDVTDVG